MLKPSLCDYSEAYTILKRTVAVTNKKTAVAPYNNKKHSI